MYFVVATFWNVYIFVWVSRVVKDRRQVLLLSSRSDYCILPTEQVCECCVTRTNQRLITQKDAFDTNPVKTPGNETCCMIIMRSNQYDVL